MVGGGVTRSGNPHGIAELHPQKQKKRTIAAYDRVNSTIAQLTAPYGDLNMAAIAAELLVIGFAIVALLTLRSQHWREIHLMSVVAVIGLFFVRWAMATFYIYLTNAAIARLPEFVDATTLAIVTKQYGMEKEITAY